ncbi:MAG: hypothetical protein Q9170_003633 [Blastenia crenularia]
MSISDESTIANTPDAGGDDYPQFDTSDVFAWLRPTNDLARDAFDATVNYVIKHARDFEHCRHFLHCDLKQQRAESFLSEEEEPANAPQIWMGGFALRLTCPPRNPKIGWIIGKGDSEDSPGKVDVLLVPPKGSWDKAHIARHHGSITFHMESCRVLLVASHTMTTGKFGAKPFRGSEQCVLEDGEIVQIGNCNYEFQRTEYSYTQAFEHSLSEYMRSYHDPQWTINPLISPSSVGQLVMKSGYLCSPRFIGRGTFGKVGAAWNRSGKAVAIKTFKDSNRLELRAHTDLMRRIGYHVSFI